MKKLLLSCAFLLYFTINAQTPKTNRITIKLKSSVENINLNNNSTGIVQIDSIAKNYNATGITKLRSGKKSKSQLFVISFPNDTNIENLVKAYGQLQTVEYAEPDYIGQGGGKKFNMTPNDQFYFRQWGLHNDGSFNLSPSISGADIDMEAAWDIEQGSSEIIVAVMDSGLNLEHPEFEGRLWSNEAETVNFEDNIDNDNNGYINDFFGWDFVSNVPFPFDDHGHGTNVTGIIAANGNNLSGYSGVDLNCKIMTLKGLNANNNGNYSWWYDAIIYAADNGARVINLSVGGNQYSQVLEEAVQYALNNNVVVVACMMNFNTSIPFYPANFEGVIAVGSTNPNDSRTQPFFWDSNSGSNYGDHISVVAPGNFIYGLSHTSNTEYGIYWGGTSQATPYVSGLAALLLAQDPGRTPAQIKSIIENTAEDQVGSTLEDIPGFDIYYGHGRINAFQALSYSLDNPEFNKNKNTLIVYPNPSKGSFNIQTESYPCTAKVYNTLGQKILEQEITTINTTINITSPGTYIVSVKSKDGSTAKKIIIE
ncbi:S8 family serine peptidase [Flavobacterium alkalisoli]|uniref:S8 family serine peptidase n=1 Tax=Flavobacterium alkalisoli TaxID=2602769 RepID=A0A5B9FWI0_9FLAO|nr:S8 family serine peptidase [Flavobacterium alkalisoli]QEE50366.1 S8 family serine peptidase [Flavobacterium alkalisoli]